MAGSGVELSAGTIAVADRAETALGSGAGPGHGRLLSLDVFRGLTIAAMMLVNNGVGPGTYGPLLHAEWHGWTFTDTIFPSFLFISGVAMTLSFAKRMETGADRNRLLLHTLRRAAVIFLLGLLLNGFPRYNLETLRIPGVLQRIAVCYAIAGAIFLFTSRRTQVWITAACLLGYWAAMAWIPVPGHGPGVWEKTGNLEQYIDSLFLSGHMYSATKIYDPEGILSTIPAVATTLFGILTGHLLRMPRSMVEKTVWMLFSANVLLFLGVFWDHGFPINKNLWTSSYATLMAGLSLATFGCCYWLIDVKGWKGWCKPWAIYGSNAIAVYVLAGLIARLVGLAGWRQPVYDALLTVANPANASLLYALGNVLLLYVVAWGLYKKGWFLKV